MVITYLTNIPYFAPLFDNPSPTHSLVIEQPFTSQITKFLTITSFYLLILQRRRVNKYGFWKFSKLMTVHDITTQCTVTIIYSSAFFTEESCKVVQFRKSGTFSQFFRL